MHKSIIALLLFLAVNAVYSQKEGNLSRLNLFSQKDPIEFVKVQK